MQNPQYKILVVDDDSFFRQLLVRLLTPHNYKVLEARSVTDAAGALEQCPDLAIIDYRMPGIDGAAFIRELRERGYTFPIVFCSGSGMDQKTFASMRNVYQVNMIIQKPIQPEMLVQQLAELLPRLEVSEQQLREELEELAEDMQEISPQNSCDENLTLDQFLREQNLTPDSESSAISGPFAESFSAADAAQAIKETEEAIAELAALYLTEVPDVLEQIKIETIMAAAQKDASLLDLAATRAHQLKGTAGSLGFSQLSQIGSALEKTLNALSKEDLSESDEKWAQIVALLDSGLQYVDKQLNGVDKNEPAQIDVIVEQITEKVIEPIIEQPGEQRLLPQRILIVEYDREAINALHEILDSERVTIRSVSGSMEAFAVMDDFQPDLVLLQSAMPGVSGNDICRMIRCNNRWQNLPVLMLVDNASLSTRQNLFSSGASDFVVTPPCSGELRLRLRSHLPALIKYDSITC